MRITNAYRSNGELRDIDYNLIPNASQTRLNEAKLFQERVQDMFEVYGYADVSELMIQPKYTDDTVVFFTKLPLSSSSDEVRLAYGLRYKPDFAFESRSQEDKLKSIFSTEKNGETSWWLLTAETITLEHNLYDGEYINLRYNKGIPYNAFIRTLARGIINENELNKDCFNKKYMPLFKHNIRNVAELLDKAIVCSHQYNRHMETIIDILKQEYNVEERDEKSNTKNLCLWHINDNKPAKHDMFMDYSEIKSYLKRCPIETKGICYTDNAIKFYVPQITAERQMIYVCRSMTNRDNRAFVTNGHIYKSIDELKRAIETSNCFISEQWYAKEVAPHIKEPVREIVDKRKDDIGWYQK